MNLHFCIVNLAYHPEHVMSECLSDVCQMWWNWSCISWWGCNTGAIIYCGKSMLYMIYTLDTLCSIHTHYSQCGTQTHFLCMPMNASQRAVINVLKWNRFDLMFSFPRWRNFWALCDCDEKRCMLQRKGANNVTLWGLFFTFWNNEILCETVVSI